MAAKSDSPSGCLIIIGLIGFALYKSYEWAKLNPVIFGFIVGSIILVISLYKIVKHNKDQKERDDRAREIRKIEREKEDQRRQRIEGLNEKYGDKDLTARIIGREIWQGQTEDQLKDALGEPKRVDRHTLKTKTREIWKYHEYSKGRFKLKITLENGVVVGWDSKDR